MGLVDSLIAQFQAQQEAANAANEKRFQQGLEIFDRIIKQEETGDVSEKAVEAAIGRGSKKAVAQGTQSLVSSGLASTTQAAGLGKKFEEEVGVPARLRAADIRQQRLSQARRDKAGFIERREDTGPDFATIAGLAQSIGAGRQARRTPVSRPSLLRNQGFGSSARKAARPRRTAPRQTSRTTTTRAFNPAAAARERRQYAARQYAAALPRRQSVSF